MTDPDPPALDRHYAPGDLLAAILDGLRHAGKAPESPSLDDLAPVDQFHSRGREATRELARLAGLRAGLEVLDVGGGLGGAARTLAREHGCRVTVLDRTEAYCRAGEALTALTGLAGMVTFRHGDATALPFEDAAFDVAWAQHCGMNVADKARLYGEMRRVLRPAGRLVLHEIMAGPAGALHLPVPWAREPGQSHLESPEESRRLLGALGFREVVWEDASRASLAWFRARLGAVTRPLPPPVSLHLVLGPDFGRMFANQVRNLEEGRIAVVQAVLERP